MQKQLLNNYNKIDLYQAQNELIEILKYFDSFCKKHNLKYFLMFGTLLGAYRSKDIIPWDDDVDVVMPKEDYLKLCELQSKITHPYRLINKSNYKTCEISYSRLLNTNVLYFKEDWKYSNNNNHNLYIDIFSFEDAPADLTQVNKFLKAVKFDFFVLKYKYNYYQPNIKSKILKPLIRLFLTPFSFKRAHINIQNKFNKYCIYKDTKSLIIPENSKGGFVLKYDKNLFENQIDLTIRGHFFPAPSDVVKILSDRYGPNFMTPLSPAEREPSKEFYVKKDC